MKFLDANPFVYAYYRPGKPLTEELKTMKNEAKSIISRIDEGEERVLTSVVHVSEIANILKRSMQPVELVEVVSGILMNENVQVEGVTPEDYLGAAESALDFRVDPNDSLAVILMRRHQIHDIYTFDRGFDRVGGIRRLPGGPEKREESGAG